MITIRAAFLQVTCYLLRGIVQEHEHQENPANISVFAQFQELGSLTNPILAPIIQIVPADVSVRVLQYFRFRLTGRADSRKDSRGLTGSNVLLP